MTEEQVRKARAQSKEFPEAMEIMGRVREALAASLFKTPVAAKDIREDLYTRVQAIDALIGEMGHILNEIKSDTDITAYVEKLATTDEK